MLNYVWLALIVLGIGVAVSTDLVEKSSNKYQNNTPIPVVVQFSQPFSKDSSRSYDVKLLVKSSTISQYYNEAVPKDVIQPAKLTYDNSKNITSLFMKVGDNSPGIWKQMAKVTGREDDLTGSVNIASVNSNSAAASVIFEDVTFAKMKDVTSSALDYAGRAVTIALELIGIMALWLGIMKVAEEAGLIAIIARALRPVTKFLFPDVPADHPAMGSMIMNISANMLGLSNAATPFGLKAMEELDKLNPEKGTATNAMCTFLAINTAGLTFIPATAIAIRAASGSADPAIIIGTSVFGATCATIVGVSSAKIMEKFTAPAGTGTASASAGSSKGLWMFLGVVALVVVALAAGLGSIIGSVFSFITPDLFKGIIQVVSILAIPLLILVFLGYGFVKKVKVYEKFVEGAKEGFNVAIRIIPYLVGMLVAIGIFRAGGAMDFLIMLMRPVTDLIGMPAEALPMALMRPLSGSGSLGIMAETIAVHGPDSLIGILVSTFYGSSETTFYVLAVYFGSVGVLRTRHALAAGLLADVAGALGALFIVKLLFG